MKLTRVFGCAALALVLGLGGCKGRSDGELADEAVSGGGPELKVSRVVLYQNGVGYIERRGKVDGDRFELRIRPDQINDMLKSLTVIDLTEGRATSVSLPVDKSAERMRQELPKAIHDGGGLLAVLDVFRGANVEARVKGKSHDGRIVGLEPFDVATDRGGAVQQWRVTLLKGAGELFVFDLSELESVTVRDRTLQVGLKKSLDISLQEGRWKPVNLTVRLTGAKGHDVVAAYVVEMPLWKPVYRIVTDKAGKPLIQGWAIIDNVSGEDWRDVRLSLVAGTPLSYVVDLHTPKFIGRPLLQPPTRQLAQAQPVFGSGSAGLLGAVGGEGAGAGGGGPGGFARGDVDDESEASEKAVDRLSRLRPSRSAAPAPAAAADAFAELKEEAKKAEEQDDRAPAAPPPPPALTVAQMETSVQALVAGSQVGTLFRYDIDEPVTVPDRSSSLVSIMNRRVPGADVYLFRPSSLANYKGLHPYRAVRFTNDTPFTLEEGPISIFSEGTFVGEGFLARTDPQQTSFVTYAIDPAVTLEATLASKESGMRLLKIVDGMVWSEVLQTQDLTYVAANERDEALTVYVRIDRTPGWTVREPATGVVATADAWFVPHEIKPKTSDTWHVVLGAPLEKSVAVTSDLATTVLRLYLDSTAADPAIKPQIARILEIQKALTEIGAESGKLRDQQGDLEQEQNRIREDLYVLVEAKGSAKLQNELKQKLADVGDQLSKVTSRLVELRQKEAEQQTELRMILRSLTLTPPATSPAPATKP